MYQYKKRLLSANNGQGFLKRLRADKAGNTFMLVAGAIIPLTGMIGAGVDVSRSYLVKSRLQQACDAGTLAGRKVMAGGTYDSTAQAAAQSYFRNNFVSGSFGSETSTFTTSLDADSNVMGSASTRLPMTVMQIFGNQYADIAVTCNAKMEVSNTDVMFVLDVTGSMADCPDGSSCGGGAGSKIAGVKQAVVDFYDILGDASSSTAQLRYGFVPYASSVNMGSTSMTGGVLPLNYIVDSASYQSRDANMNTPEVTATPGPPTVTTETYSSAISSTNCSNYGRNQYPTSGANPVTSGTAPSPTTSTSYSNNATAGIDWGWSSAAVKTGTNRTCRRTKTVVVTTYTATGYFFFTNWTYQQSSIDVSSFKQGNALTISTGTTGKVNHSATYTLATYAANAIGDTTANYSWNGCIEEGDTVVTDDFTPIPAAAYDLQVDLIPTDDHQKWRPMFKEMAWNRSGTATETRTGDTTQPNNSYAACPKRARKLSVMTKADVQAYVNAADFTPNGGTYHDAGMAWGARLISPTGMFASENTAAPNGKPIDRNIIFMTDGDMAPNALIYGMHGIENLDRRVTGSTYNLSDMTTLHNSRFVALCDAARSKNIKVWVIAFGTATTPELTACADPGRLFFAGDTATLRSNFQTIAARIASLRLSQ